MGESHEGREGDQGEASFAVSFAAFADVARTMILQGHPVTTRNGGAPSRVGGSGEHRRLSHRRG